MSTDEPRKPGKPPTEPPDDDAEQEANEEKHPGDEPLAPLEPI